MHCLANVTRPKIKIKTKRDPSFELKGAKKHDFINGVPTKIKTKRNPSSEGKTLDFVSFL